MKFLREAIVFYERPGASGYGCCGTLDDPDRFVEVVEDADRDTQDRDQVRVDQVHTDEVDTPRP